MRDAFIRTANLMQSSPTLNSPLKKTNSELISALSHALRDNLQHDSTQIQDERTEYEITMKLFYLPQSPQDVTYLGASLEQVKTALGIEDIDLLILSFPNIVLDAEDTGVFETDDFSRIKQLYNAAASLVTTRQVKALGVAEFSASRLQQLCEAVEIAPEVNQINLKDCCVTPRDLIVYAKEKKVKLFTHGDASDILPTETLQGLVKDYASAAATPPDAKPLWVCKYTAVASTRGVVENKGYIVAIDK